MKKILLLLLIPWPIRAMEQDGISKKKNISKLEQENILRENLKNFLRTAEKNLGVDPHWLAYNNEIEEAARTDERGLIEISTHITDEDRLKYQICHELGHSKDGTFYKKMLAMGAYYPSCIIVPSLLLYGIQHIVPTNRDIIGASYAGLAMSGIFGSLFFHNTINHMVNRHLEKRADLIGIEYLVNAHDYAPISKTLIGLQQSKLLGAQHDIDHPAPSDIYDYLTGFLRKNKIDVQSEFQRNTDNTLNGSLALIKDGQTVSQIKWLWKPKC
ncbi:hypothetical protein BH09DEP1_BH09DEP1_6930 [soil metagenome]